MNVYDFDGTIYDGDSTIDFWKFCLKKYKSIIFTIPYVLFAYFRYCFGFITKTQFKEIFFRFLLKIPDVESEISAFWNINSIKIKEWYLSVKENTDLIISASPEFLLRPITNKLGVGLIGSKVDANTGKFAGENCKGEEKVRKFRELYPDAKIQKFYSDSLSDSPLAEISNQAYYVTGDKITPWDDYKPSQLERFRQTFVSKEFIIFIFCGGMGTLTNFVFSLLISCFIDPTISYIFGYLISLFVTYALSAKLIFSAKLHVLSFGKFVISYIPNFIVQILCVALFINLLGWYKAIAYAIAILIGLPISFVLVKIFAFGKHKINKPKNANEQK